MKWGAWRLRTARIIWNVASANNRRTRSPGVRSRSRKAAPDHARYKEAHQSSCNIQRRQLSGRTSTCDRPTRRMSAMLPRARHSRASTSAEPAAKKARTTYVIALSINPYVTSSSTSPARAAMTQRKMSNLLFLITIGNACNIGAKVYIGSHAQPKPNGRGGTTYLPGSRGKCQRRLRTRCAGGVALTNRRGGL